MIPNLGRIQEVPLREVWDNEATSFTPWLLENEDVLSELLGIDITLERREESVGRFSLDLIGRNNDDGSTVIVENQLGGTDHSHLGQLLTYAGGLDAHTIIWVAADFRDEHRAALDWLNRVTGEETHFYGVVVRAVKIGDSLAAPELSLAAKPNDFEKGFKASSSSTSREERKARYFEFWTKVKGTLEGQFPDFSNRKVPDRQYYGVRTGYGDCHRIIAISNRELKVELYFGHGDPEVNDSRFEALYERKQEIEELFGEKLSWEALEGRKAARIALYRDASSIRNVDEWDDYLEWIEDHFARLTKVTDSQVFADAMSEA